MKILLATIAVSLVMAPAALAASSSLDGYGGPGGQIQTSVDPSPPSGTASGNTLPFTGYDVLGIGGVGLLLAGLGVSLRIAQRRGDARA
jgi:hypothetical protein